MIFNKIYIQNLNVVTRTHRSTAQSPKKIIFVDLQARTIKIFTCVQEG